LSILHNSYKQISKEIFDQLIEQKEPTILVFGAQWSGNSAIVDQMMKRLSMEASSKINFYKVDIENQKAIAELFHLQRVPTVIMLKDGDVKKAINGFLPAAKMKAIISEIYA
jgi:thioredoxin 1